MNINSPQIYRLLQTKSNSQASWWVVKTVVDEVKEKWICKTAPLRQKVQSKMDVENENYYMRTGNKELTSDPYEVVSTGTDSDEQTEWIQ